MILTCIWNPVSICYLICINFSLTKAIESQSPIKCSFGQPLVIQLHSKFENLPHADGDTEFNFGLPFCIYTILEYICDFV